MIKKIAFVVAVLALVGVGLSIKNVEAAGAQAPPPPDTGTLKINLPPKSVYLPNKLVVEGKEYTFSSVTEQFSGPATFTVQTSKIRSGSALESYVITVSPITRGQASFLPGMEKVTALGRFINSYTAKAYAPPPATNYLLLGSTPVYDFKLTFTPVANGRTAVNNLINLDISTYDYLIFSDSNCTTVAAQDATYICFKPTTSLVDFSGSINGSLLVKELVKLDRPGRIEVEGNALAVSQIGGFVFPQAGGWVAVGGSFTAGFQQNNGQNNQLLNSYIQNTNSKLEWGDGSQGTVGYKVRQKYNNGKAISTKLTNANYSGVFHLNSVSLTDPSDTVTSSFTTLPGGKIWSLDRGAASTFTFTNMNMRGFGTILINGNLVVNGSLDCQSGTRLGVIATGNIVFNNPNIDCGAFVAMGTTGAGNITFAGNISTNAAAKGIFAAKGNIALPTIDETREYLIKYDSVFARDPSALFDEVLEILFTTTS